MALLISSSGCSAVGYRHVPALVTPPTQRPANGGPVILVVIDGLRRDVLADYRAALLDVDDEPDWRSGIALLRSRGFHTALAGQAESSVPAVGLGPLAAIGTGFFAGRNGVPASRFRHATVDGRLRRYDFLDARDAGHIYFAPGLAPATAEHPPALGQVVSVPTLYQRLAKQVSTTAVFDPFAWGATWLVPASSEGINALLPTTIGAAAAPLFDRGVLGGALAVARQPVLPQVLTLYFRELLVESCRNAPSGCNDGATVRALQRKALLRIDGHLHRLFRTLSVAHPKILDRTTVILVGTGGVADRPAQGPVLTERDFLKQIGTAAGGTCGTHLNEAVLAGVLGLEVQGAALLATLARAPAGQQLDRLALRTCLGDGLKALTATSGVPVAAAAWTDGKGTRHAALHPGSRAYISASRRPRTLAKLKRALTPPGAVTTAVDAVAILIPGTVFDGGEGPGRGVRGSLESETVGLAILVADRKLDPTATRALRGATIEITDLAPTIAQLAGLTDATWPRPPFLARRADGALIMPRADRMVRADAEAPAGLKWHETPDAIEVSFTEAGTLWPPDVFTAQLGETTWAWDVDQGRFGADSPCAYTESTTLRTWRCTLPRTKETSHQTFTMVRDPAPDEDAAEGAKQIMARDVVLGQGEPAVQALSLQCAEPNQLKLMLEASDPIGLSRVSVFLADGRGAGAQGRVPGSATADQSLEGTTHQGSVTVPFSRTLLSHHRRARRLFGAPSEDRKALRLRIPQLKQPLKDAYLAVQICSLSGRCVQRPLITDVAYLDALEAGCP